MGCAGSRFDEVPVTGYQGQGNLSILPVGDRYISQDNTVLKLKEKFWSFSGDDADIKDGAGNKIFRVNASVMSMSGRRTMESADGAVICGYQKKLLTLHATAYITLESGGQTLAVATIKKRGFMSLESCADIYLHRPPIPVDDVSCEGLNPDIMVEGDFISKKYDFMMGDLNTQPFKIAQVVRKLFGWDSERNTYFVNIGPRVDVPFICMCVIAIDEIFSDQNK